MPAWVEIDGAQGEGGGQVLRTALALSLVTGRPFRIADIRARRRKPGLAPQHLTAVEAAAALCGGSVEGAAVGATALAFRPGAVRPGRYRFDIGTAGATGLLLHALHLPLALAGGPSTLVLRGGTHVPFAPTFEYLNACWAPLLAAMGLDVRLELRRAGFYPPGGGELHVHIAGGGPPAAVDWSAPAAPRRLAGRSRQARLQPRVAERQVAGAMDLLSAHGLHPDWCVDALDAASPGTVAALAVEFPITRACVTALGERGKPAEAVGREAAEGLLALLDSGAPLDAHAADQVLLPLALAGGRSVYLAQAVTSHLTTNAAAIRQFLDVPIDIRTDAHGRALVRVGRG